MDKKMELPEKKQILHSQACFKLLNDAELDVLAGLLKEVKFTKGDTIVTEGEPVDSVFFIIDGSADVRHIRIKNNELDVTSIANLHPGETIGLSESGFYSLNGLRTATVTANETITALRLSVAAFNGFALANSHVGDVLKRQSQKTLSTPEIDK